MLSVIIPTIHPGGMDFLVESFASNPPNWEYEVILVDDYPGRVERGLVEKFLRLHGVKLGWYGKSKAKTLPSVCGWVNAVNTGLFHARGDFILISQDYTTLTFDWFLRWHSARVYHEQKQKNRKFHLSGTAIEHLVPKPKRYDDLLSWPDEPEVWQDKYALISHPWVPEDFETFYWGFPISFIEEINGFDERADHCSSWIMFSVLKQMEKLGYSHFVEPQLVCQMVNHRNWNEPEKEKPAHQPGSPFGMWKIESEWRSTEEEFEWTVPSPNNFSFINARKEFAK